MLFFALENELEAGDLTSNLVLVCGDVKLTQYTSEKVSGSEGKERRKCINTQVTVGPVIWCW